MRNLIGLGLIWILGFLISDLSAKEYTLHAGLGAASGTRYGMPFTLGGSFQGGEIPLTVLKPEFEAGLWYMNDSEAQYTLCDEGPCRETTVSWWSFYQGVRLNIDAVASTTGLLTQQGLGLAVVEAIPYQLIRDSKTATHHRVGRTETSLMGHGFIRYDLNPGRPVGLYVEGDVWIKLTGRESQESASELLLGKLGVRFPGF